MTAGNSAPFAKPIAHKKGQKQAEGEAGPGLDPSAPYSRYRAFLHCPLCLKEVLSTEDARLLTNLIHNGLLEEAEVYLSVRGLRLFMLEPEGEARQLLNRRVVVGAVCMSHRQVDFERIEYVCVLASKYGQVTKETL